MDAFLEKLTRSTIRLEDRPHRVGDNPVLRGPVVLATDGESHTGATVAMAQLIAARHGLPLEVVSVFDRTPTYGSSPDATISTNPTIDEMRRTTCETRVKDYLARFSGGAPTPRVHVRFGRVTSEIARFAREKSATVVVIGAAPHERFGHVTSGGRAARVLHDIPCPVLSVPPMHTALPRCIVAAMDFGSSSTRAAQAALLVADRGARIILAHVIPPPVRPAVLNIVPPEELAIDVHALLDDVIDEIGPYVPDGVKVETGIITGDTVDAILSMAADVRADLIAVGTHGHGLLSRLSLGGVTRGVLHRANQLVLAVPPPPD